MTVAYPSHLPSFLKAGKSRTQPASFRMLDPRRGRGYQQKIGTDSPVFWDVTWTFTRPQALQFRLWFDQVLDHGIGEFTMPIDTEFGLITYACLFLPDSLLPTRDSGNTWTYSATIMARSMTTPDEYAGDVADLIVGLPDWEAYAGLLDRAMTAAMPVA